MGGSESTPKNNNLLPQKSFYRTNSGITQAKENQQNIQNNEEIFHHHLKNFMKRHKLNYPNIEDYERMYQESGDNTQKFFQLIQERISDLYINLSKQTLELMESKRLSQIESKIFISQQILETSINILKAIGIKTNFKYDPQTVNRLNQLQHSMLGYMKAKYPRSGQGFVPGELMKEFKNFDLIQQPQNDMLKAIKIHFGQLDQRKLILKVKKFINLLIDELDSKFLYFQSLLSQKVFSVTKQGKQYSVFNRIGRKIPQNIQRLNQQQDSTFDMKSPQIFRVIVKWVNQMQEFLLHPDEQIQNKDNFKLYNKAGKETQFDYITTDQIQPFLQSLQNNLNEFKVQYENELQELKKYLEIFNHSLLKILTKAERKQKYVPKRQAEVIKYSMFNTKLLSWMLIEKLMLVLKKLIKTSQKFEQNQGLHLDLIRFNVADLMRAMIVGNKFEMIKVFNNMKKLETENLIKIVKITNRLETPLNDILIIFKMSNSFLLCELQLILSDGGVQSGSDKLKNIELLNHFFYELDRSQYGVMAEVAALLGFKDNKIIFQQKITFEKIPQFNLDACQKSHPQSIQSHPIQKNPFICSQCTTYYGSYQNEFVYKSCKQCHQYLCIKCILASKSSAKTQLEYINQAIYAKLTAELKRISAIQEIQVRTNYIKEYLDAQFADHPQNINKLKKNFFNKNSIKLLRDITKKKNTISLKELQKYIENLYPAYYETIYFIIGKFVGGQLTFLSLKYNKRNGVSYCFNQYENNLKELNYKYFDFVILNKDIEPQDQKSKLEKLKKSSNINLFKNFDLVEGYQKYLYIVNSSRFDICMTYIIFDTYEKNANRSALLVENKKEFTYESIEVMRKNLPNLIQTQEVYNLGNQGISDVHLNYFKNIEWKTAIKYLNLHNNKIKDISILLTELPNIQKLIVSKNYLTKISFKVKLLHLSKLIAFYNQIDNVEGLTNIPAISNLNLESNKLTQFDFTTIKLPQLSTLNLNENQIVKLKSLTEQNFQKLTNVTIYGNSYNVTTTGEDIIISLPYLTTLSLFNFVNKTLTIKKSDNLENLIFNRVSCDVFDIEETKYIKKFTAEFCWDNYFFSYGSQGAPEFFANLLQKDFSQLETLKLQHTWHMPKLPKLQTPNLKYLSLEYNYLENVSALNQTNLLNLEKFILKNKVAVLPSFKCPKLKEIFFDSDGITIEDISALSQWETPALTSLTILNISQQKEIPSLKNFPILKELCLTGGKFEQNFKISNEKLQKLILKSIGCQNFPYLDLLNLQEFELKQCWQVNINNLQNCNLPKLKEITGIHLQLLSNNETLPVLNFPALEYLSLSQCNIKNIENLSLSNLTSLKYLNLSQNVFEKVPTLKCTKLEELVLNNGLTTDISMFEFSNLPQLKKLHLQASKITQFPILDCPKLQVIEAQDCNIADLGNLTRCKLPELKTLSVSNNPDVKVFPEVKLPKLTTFNIDFRNLINYQNLQKSELDEVQTLDFSYVQLENAKLPKLNLPKITNLILNGSNISDISNLQHSNLPNMTLFQFNTACVTVLPIMKFKSLKALRSNSLVERKEQGKVLTSVDNLQYSDLPELQTIQMENHNLIRLPKMNLKKLKVLYITDSGIQDLTQFNQSNLPSLEMINFYNNPLKLLPIGKQVKALSIYLNRAEVASFKDLVEFAPLLDNFYYNHGEMPEIIPQMSFKNVKILQFESCQLTNADIICKNPFPLATQITFSFNKIVKPPKIIAPNLQNMHLKANRIKDISIFLKSEIPSIKLITFQNNEIQNLPDFPFPNVELVYFSTNLITDISCLSKYTYKNLRMLVFWNLKIKTLCKFNTPALESVYLNQNQIQSLEPMKDSSLQKLNYLELSNNRITDLSPLSKINFKSLTTCFMNNNKVKKLCKLDNMPTLQYLQLKQNPIENVDEFVSHKINSLCGFSYSLSGKEELRHKNEDTIRNVYFYGSTYYPVRQYFPEDQQNN